MMCCTLNTSLAWRILKMEKFSCIIRETVVQNGWGESENEWKRLYSSLLETIKTNNKKKPPNFWFQICLAKTAQGASSHSHSSLSNQAPEFSAGYLSPNYKTHEPPPGTFSFLSTRSSISRAQRLHRSRLSWVCRACVPGRSVTCMVPRHFLPFR